MSKRGRPKKSMEPQDVSRRKETGTRILKWRKKMGWTQEYMAEQMEKSVAAVRRYEKGEVDLHENAAKKLEFLSGIFWRYWTGETTCTESAAYTDEQRRLHEDAAMEELEEILKDENERSNKLTSLFSLCGFRYERDKTLYAFYDMLDDWDDSDIPPCEHRITPYHAPDQTYYFSDDELTALLVDMKTLVGYHWYKKVEAHNSSLKNK